VNGNDLYRLTYEAIISVFFMDGASLRSDGYILSLRRLRA
jgi:hypothetical protein